MSTCGLTLAVAGACSQSDGFVPAEPGWTIRGSLELRPHRKGKGNQRGRSMAIGVANDRNSGSGSRVLAGSALRSCVVRCGGRGGAGGRLDRAVRPARLLPRAVGVLVPTPPQVKHYRRIFVPALAWRLESGRGWAFTVSFFCSTSSDGVMSSRRSGLP